MARDPFKALREFRLAGGRTRTNYSLGALEAAGLGRI